MDGGMMPLPSRPQQYCDPASLVHMLTSKEPLNSNPHEKRKENQGFQINFAQIFCFIAAIASVKVIGLTSEEKF